MSRYPDLSRLSAPVPSNYGESSETAESRSRPTLERKSGGSKELTGASVTSYLQQRSPNLARSSVARTEQELLNRPYHPLSCTVSLSMKDVKTGSNIQFKFDGNRFKHADTTIKVTSGATYELSLTIKPNMEISNNLLYLKSSPPDGAPRQHAVSLSRNRVDGKSTSGSWKCELEASKKSERVPLELSGIIANFGQFAAQLMLKVYPEDTKGALQGFKLKIVILEFKREQDEADSVQLKSIRYMT